MQNLGSCDRSSSKKGLFFQDTKENQEQDAKQRLLILTTGPEKVVTVIHRLKAGLIDL